MSARRRSEESRQARGRRGLRLERLLPLACLAAAGLLLASNFTTVFELTPPGAEALAEQSAYDRLSFAPAVFAAFAAIMLVITVGTGSKPAAIAVAACGVIALALFLILILPDAGNVGTFDDDRQTFATVEAVPQAGFWLQLAGALGLAITGAALATLTPDQLKGLRPGRRASQEGDRDSREGKEHDRDSREGSDERRRKATTARTQADRRRERA